MDYFIAAALGLILGCFATAMIYRVPRDMDWTMARSACPNCRTPLSPRDLIPLFSWLVCHGKCRHCGKPISKMYPVVESLSALACIFAYAWLGWSIAGISLIAAIPFLVALLVIDLERLILPDSLNLIVAVIGAARLAGFYAAGGMEPVFIAKEYIAGAVLYALVAWVMGKAMTLFLKKDALGFGDVKFFAVAGLWLGLSILPLFLIASGVLGVILGLLWRMSHRGNIFPFGPALIAAFYLLLTFPGLTGFLLTFSGLKY